MLSNEAEFTYKCTEFYHGEDESGIDWQLEGIDEIILSDKDRSGGTSRIQKSGIEFTHNLVWFINKIKTSLKSHNLYITNYNITI